MSDYRPICDFWLLARPKVAYYGAYPAGFVQRARHLLGASLTEPVLHVCSGKIREYPWPHHLGAEDKTLDIDPELKPDFLQDARDPWPRFACFPRMQSWKAVLIDPPYTEDDATHYACGAKVLPTAAELLARAWEVTEPGNRVGLLHYILPKPPKDAIFVAAAGVVAGYNNRIRVFSVFEKRLTKAA